jgi:hypothetical protein
VAGSAAPLPPGEVAKLLGLADAARTDRPATERAHHAPAGAPTTRGDDERALVEAITRAVLARLGQ